MKYSSCFLALLFVVVYAFPQWTIAARKQRLAGAEQPTGSGKTKGPKAAADQTTAPAEGQASDLESVFSKMDADSANFRSAEANLTQEYYEKVVDDHHTENGRIYFRRTSKGLQMAMDFINSSDSKYVLLTDDKVRVYQPKIDQITEYNLNKYRAEVNSMFALGFGGRGHDLIKSFDVKLGGSQTMDGVNVTKLELAPKTEGLKRYFSRIELWVDVARDVSLQQQFWQPSGDYRLAHYSNIKLNQKVPDTVFKLQTTSRTKVVTP